MDESQAVGGVFSLIRADHIGRPVFATNAGGVKVWTASHPGPHRFARAAGGKQSTGLSSGPPHPFGGVTTPTGTVPDARFPGQWFQSESGLHQNWMRDYDPTTGRYLQADPLGLVDGASVYGYVGGNPGRWVDPRGEESAIPGGFGGTFGEIVTGAGKGALGAIGGALLGIVWGTPAGESSTQYVDVEGFTCYRGCPPCQTVTGRLVSVGTFGYRPLDLKPGHGIPGPHHNVLKANQVPAFSNNPLLKPCSCFWQPKSWALGENELVPGMIPAEPFTYRPPL